MIYKSCLWWFGWFWRKLKLGKLVTKYWVHVFSGLVSGAGEAVEIVYTFLYVVKYGKTPFGGGGLWKSRWVFDAYLIGFSYKTAEIHSMCIGRSTRNLQLVNQLVVIWLVLIRRELALYYFVKAKVNRLLIILIIIIKM